MLNERFRPHIVYGAITDTRSDGTGKVEPPNVPGSESSHETVLDDTDTSLILHFPLLDNYNSITSSGQSVEMVVVVHDKGSKGCTATQKRVKFEDNGPYGLKAIQGETLEIKQLRPGQTHTFYIDEGRENYQGRPRFVTVTATNKQGLWLNDHQV